MSGKKLLLVDDDRDLQQSLGIRLRASGFQVAIAGDAVQAISAVRRESPDLVLLDIGLPGGDGYLVLERLRAMSGSAVLPVIVLSARDPELHEKKMLDSGADAFFQKPADNAALLTKVRELLGEPAPGVAA